LELAVELLQRFRDLREALACLLGKVLQVLADPGEARGDLLDGGRGDVELDAGALVLRDLLRLVEIAVASRNVLGLVLRIADDDLAGTDRGAGFLLAVMLGDVAGQAAAGGRARRRVAGPVAAGRRGSLPGPRLLLPLAVTVDGEADPRLSAPRGALVVVVDVGEAKRAGVEDEVAGERGDDRAVDLGVALDAGVERFTIARGL